MHKQDVVWRVFYLGSWRTRCGLWTASVCVRIVYEENYIVGSLLIGTPTTFWGAVRPVTSCPLNPEWFWWRSQSFDLGHLLACTILCALSVHDVGCLQLFKGTLDSWNFLLGWSSIWSSRTWIGFKVGEIPHWIEETGHVIWGWFSWVEGSPFPSTRNQGVNGKGNFFVDPQNAIRKLKGSNSTEHRYLLRWLRASCKEESRSP